jgi:hypothetical protein
MRTTLALFAVAAIAVVSGQTDTATATVTQSPIPNFTPDAAIVTAAGPIIGAVVGSLMGGFGIIGLVGYGLYRYEQAQREAKVIARMTFVPAPA